MEQTMAVISNACNRDTNLSCKVRILVFIEGKSARAIRAIVGNSVELLWLSAILMQFFCALCSCSFYFCVKVVIANLYPKTGLTKVQ